MPRLRFLVAAAATVTTVLAGVPVAHADEPRHQEWNPLEPNEGHQLKFHAPGIGTMRVGAVGGKEKEVLVLIDVRQLDAEQMAEARQAALKLEARAYEISDVYRDTPPLEICDTGGGCSPAG